MDPDPPGAGDPNPKNGGSGSVGALNQITANRSTRSTHIRAGNEHTGFHIIQYAHGSTGPSMDSFWNPGMGSPLRHEYRLGAFGGK